MKKITKTILAASLAACCVLAVAGCNSIDTITQTPNQGVEQGTSASVGKYDKIAYYELERPQDVAITFETDKIQKVSFKYRNLTSDEYNLSSGVLTIKSGVFEGESAGDKRLRVFVDNQYTEITVRIVSKVIYTTEDFNSIRNNLNGVFVLGADIDFGGDSLIPIGRTPEGKTNTFEGVFDGMGYTVKNIVLNGREYSGKNEGYHTGPNTGDPIGNELSYGIGIFASTGGSAQIVNTNFSNITVKCQGLGGAVAGSNGGLIKNCRVSCTLYSYGECEKAGGITGTNGSGDAAGKIENCIVTYTYGAGTPRGIADWNVGTIRNCVAAGEDNFVYYPDYDFVTGKRDENFSYDNYLTADNWTQWIYTNYSLPAFPGTVDTKTWTYYPGGQIINSEVVEKTYLLNPANFTEEDGWDTSIWNFTYGMYPTLKIQSK